MEIGNKNFQILTDYILSFSASNTFNTNLIEEWTIELINLGYENESIFMLASFSKPIEYYEIESYLKKVFSELKLVEKNKLEAEQSILKFHVNQIVNLNNVRTNLRLVADFFYSYESDFIIRDFYLLNYAWDDLEEQGETYYYENVSLETIEKVVFEKAVLWLGRN